MELLEIMENALDKAEQELTHASYLSESGANAGIRKMNDNKAEWLRWVVYLAQHGLEALEEEDRLAAEQELVEEENEGSICEKCPVSAEALKLTEVKDEIIKELTAKTEDLTAKLDSLQLTYDCELEYRKALAQRAKIDHFTEVLKLVHERCWLDGTDLVCSIDYLDKYLLELIKE